MENCFLPIHAHIPLIIIISVKYFRFLEFIARLLDSYSLSPHDDVKEMFEVTYRSILEDDPDSESLKKHTVCFHQNSIPICPLSLCTYLAFVLSFYILTLQNLLASVHSNEEFKSLLGNPKNIKDCGSVAVSLKTLTDRWDKLSVSPTLL